jgi:hypothetical protein
MIILNTLDARDDERSDKYRGDADLNSFDPWSLVEIDKSTSRIVGTKIDARECRLERATYKVEFTPKVFNSNLLGRCGVAMSTHVRITRDEEDLLPTTALWKDCHDRAYISEVRVVERKWDVVVEVTRNTPFYHRAKAVAQ